MKRSSFSWLVLGILIIDGHMEDEELNLNFHQQDYQLTYERTDLVRYNKDYIKDMSIVTFKYNRTQAVSNWTLNFKTDFGNDLITMSYIGSIGYIMQGRNGFKEALSVIYAPNSKDKMPNGHAYARAVRGHSLLHLTLTIIISKNIDSIEDLNETKRSNLTAQAYTFLSNEYRLFPVHFAMNVCKALQVNTAGLGRMLTCGNFTNCPLVKGKKHICNFFPDGQHMPPFIPNGRYKVEFLAEYLSKEVFVINAYASVTRPFPWQSKLSV